MAVVRYSLAPPSGQGGQITIVKKLQNEGMD
jgi:hypothetical protein